MDIPLSVGHDNANRCPCHRASNRSCYKILVNGLARACCRVVFSGPHSKRSKIAQNALRGGLL